MQLAAPPPRFPFISLSLLRLTLAVVLALVWTFAMAPASAAVASEAAPAATSAEAPTLQGLVQLLEDPAARDRLIGELRQLAAQPAAAGQPPPDAAPVAAAAPPSDDSLPARLADHSQQFLQGLADDARTAVTLIQDLGSLTDEDSWWEAWLVPLCGVALVILATLIAYAIFRAIARRGYQMLDHRVAVQRQRYEAERAAALEAGVPQAAHGGRSWFLLQWRRVLAILGALLIDILCVLAAVAAGYGATMVVGGYFGRVGVFEPLFLNAFVVTEITKALVRGVFATRFPDLRLFRMADDVAVYWYRWLAVLITLVGYGTLLLVPMLQMMFTPAVGHLVGLLLMVGVYIYAVRVIWRNRIVIRDRLLARAKHSSSALFGTLLRMLARSWHVLALGYFTLLLVVSQVAPERALPFMAGATVQTVVAVGIALLLSMLLTALLSRRVRLSDEWRARLPLLEARLNSYVPAVLHGARLAILVVAALVVLDAWRVFRLADWLGSVQGQALLSTVIRVAIILALAACAWVVLASVIEHRISALPGADGASARERTLLSLFRNAALIVIVTLTTLVVLSQIGIDIGPLIAGAGVIGLAIGFGAQKLVQDVITGVFIQVENGMNQNDVVEVAGVFGTVEKITIRSVSLRTLDGGFHMIPFSSIDKVSNHMRDFSYHLGHYTVSYRESVEDAIVHLEAAFKELMEDEVLAPEILEDISIPGVTSLDDRGVTIRVLIKTTPGMQWAVQRGYNRLVKKHFSAAGIELSYPHTVVYFGQDKNGYAPPARVRAMVAQADDGQTIEADLLSDGQARAPGVTPRPLRPTTHRSEDVLGNELDTVVDDEGERKEEPAPQPK
ncbi:MAG: mechanosensitive ion channel domain-containing protein, partial [Pigmentiphaga sp.]